MFRVHCIDMNGVWYFHYFSPHLNISNGLLNDPNGDGMEKLHHREVNIPTYFFEVYKSPSVLYYWVMCRVQNIWKHGVGPLQYLFPQRYLSNCLLSDPNWHLMQKVCSTEVDIPTYHLGVKKTISFSYYKVFFRIQCIQIHYVGYFYYFSAWRDLWKGLLSNPNIDHIWLCLW